MKCEIAKTASYTVTSGHCEMPAGSKFNVHPGLVTNGQLCLCEINGLLIVGRRFQLEDHSWIVQPDRWIRIANPADIKIVGAVVT